MSSFWNRSLYHLLRTSVDVGLHETAEFRDAVVDMHDEVACLNLL